MKMSDALRGAADSAPIQDVHVSTSLVRSRARRSRALRTGANGLVGVGAAALVFAGVMGAIANQTSLAAAENSNGSGSVSQPNTGVGDQSVVAPGFDLGKAVACGTGLDLSQFPTSAVTSTASVGDIDGSDLPVMLTYDAAPFSVTLGAPVHYVLWHDIVVGTTVGSPAGNIGAPAGATTIDAASKVQLNNCWDAADLPAGDYTVVTVTPVSADIPPVAEPTGAPTEPSATPSPTASDPNAAVSGDAANATTVAPDLTFTVTDAMPFTIPGEPVDNPFDQYLKVPVDPTPLPTVPAGPSDALTTDEARAAYAAALTSASWDMAKGTHRVVLTSSSDDPNGDLWATSYYGCPTDGASTSFPAQSADLNWLDVNAQLPASIHVSYGWVVDGNPLVTYGVKNVTDWSLPGFYQGSTPRLVLVKDGRVVAEAYPVSPDQSGGGIAYAADGIAPAGAGSAGNASTRDSLIWAPSGDGYLAPGASVSGDYLWRDLNGCWTSDGASTVAPGTYTVLTAQDIYVGGQFATMGGGIADGAPAEGAPASGASTDTSKVVAPAPDQSGSYASFQVWTSLGSMTVTN